jgi:hypothetical protein
MSQETHVELGQVLIAIAEPHRETLDTYHRWFERDHMYSAVLIGPGAFAANRFVAPRPLKELRYPVDGGVFPRVEQGTFAALYFIAEGMAEEHFAWSFAQSAKLGREGRNDPNRELTLTWLCDYRGSVGANAASVPPEIALDHAFPGLVMVWVDRNESVTQDELQRWLEEELLPRDIAGSGADQVLIFTPRDFPPPDPDVPLTPGAVNANTRVGKAVLLLYFLGDEPQRAWQPYFASLGEQIAKGSRGRLALAAPFVPTPRGKRADPAELW